MSADIPAVLPGHWETAEGMDMAREYATKTRADLAMSDKSDLGLANALYLVDGPIMLQTAAKERMRWLSVQLALATMPQVARPLSEWHEDMGDVLWWKFPITEAPWVGTPLDLGLPVESQVSLATHGKQRTRTAKMNVGGWPGYHTHFTPLPQVPRAPA